MRETFNIGPGLDFSADQMDLIEGFIGSFEFELLGFPVRAVFEHLGNVAGQPVLRHSIVNVVGLDPLEKLIAEIWAAEINAAKGKAALMSAIRNVPPSTFFRVVLSTHFLIECFGIGRRGESVGLA